MEIKSISDFRKAMRIGPYAWPGGYPLYFITSDGAALSFDAAKAERRNILEAIRDKDNNGWRIVGMDINYEDGELYCEHTNERIPSAYAEPEDMEAQRKAEQRNADRIDGYDRDDIGESPDF
jgi:hypothetical protein